jgi:transcription-repair coupling factor (superfamily II helicase)
VKIGDPVVHESHGIGRYQGLVHLDLGEGETEFLHLEYAGGDKLYVPVSQLHLISRYSGAPPEPVAAAQARQRPVGPAKRKAAQQVRDTAAELLALYARRAARQGHAFNFKQHDYEAFADGFGFEETPDQAAAIAAVVADMKSGKPMDRLVCGDVGFGKTEVALRAAFVAVADGKQVAVLVPTTLLAEQHFQNFRDRFADWPVRIEELSRFRSARGTAAALKGWPRQGRHRHRHAQAAAEGREVQEPRPGHHRRGAPLRRAPEGALKAAARRGRRADADRHADPAHLGMALEGLRDFSVIATAPQKRLAIKTFVVRTRTASCARRCCANSSAAARCTSCTTRSRPSRRCGARAAALLPEARIAGRHGQMPERELER